MDVNVAKAVDSFMPVVLTAPGAAGAKAFVKLTEECLMKLEASKALYQSGNTKMNLTNLE
ncbi:ParA-like protein [uncultured Coleofasciculus sp.]|uniref:ParA-like protein n=1 Tax=uncultured Coleofasciculus sp. TaxID=1267456 RepID=A0A6J4JMM7_9CYAN|nr:ParA-like protein [uncultured Coleofasciculus sp.]